MRIRDGQWFGFCMLACLTACSSSERKEDVTAAQGMALTMGVDETTGVVGMNIEVVPVDCEDGTALPDADPIVVDKDLDELRLPAGTPELVDNPLDGGSAHVFSDFFLTLEPGCYDVTTLPLTEDGMVCHEASAPGTVVNEGETTEVFLINQCDGSDPGAMDVIATANHPPVLLDVSFQDSKFTETCEAQVICATAQDPEKDPLEFEWLREAGPAITDPVVVSHVVHDDGSITQCVSFIPQSAGRVDLVVTVYDVVHNGTGFVRIEDWLAAEGYPEESHTSLSLPSYATGSVAPVDELCGDDVDNDCDGLIDEDCGVPPEGCPDGEVPVCTPDIDVMVLEDLSGSFGDDLLVLRSLAPDLVDALAAATAGSMALGDASFIDKPFYPYGSAGDYVYELELPLAPDGAGFVDTIMGLEIGYGSDYSEAQLEALNLVAINADADVGFRAGTERFVILTTDATFHEAPECLAAGLCGIPNNMDGTADLAEDYPSQAQVIESLNAANITPVFAVVGAGVKAPYEAFVAGLERGSVVDLQSDSSNLINAIFTGLGSECECMPE